MDRDALDTLARLDDDALANLVTLAQQLEDPDAAAAAAEVGRKHRDRSTTRRDLLKAGGAVGAGALMGGAATGAASAQADDTDSVPDVGTPSQPVDVFGDGVSANSVSTDNLFDAQRILVYSDSGYLIAAIDPDEFTNPINEAIDTAAANGGGTVEWAGRVSQPATVLPKSDVDLKGDGLAEIEITETANDLMEFSGGKQRRVEVKNVRLVGQGDDVHSARGVVHLDNTPDLRMAQVQISGIHGAGYYVDSTADPFQCEHTGMRFDVDGGDANGIIDWQGAGAPNTFKNTSFYPTATTSAANSTCIHTQDAILSIEGFVNVGGSAGKVLEQVYGDITMIAATNYEATSQQSTPDHLFDLRRERPAKILGGVRFKAGAADYIYRLGFNNGQKMLTAPKNRGGTLNNTAVSVGEDPASTSWYFGPSSDITVNHAGSNEGEVRSLASAGTGNG